MHTVSEGAALAAPQNINHVDLNNVEILGNAVQYVPYDLDQINY